MSVANTKSVTIDNLVTTTHFKVRDNIIDQVYKKRPLWNKLAENGGIKSRVPDGTHFEIPVRYAKNDQNFQYFGRGATFSRNDKETLTRLIYYTRNAGISMVRYFDDERKNRGESRIIDWVGELVQSTHEAYVDKLSEDILSQSTDSLSINALPTLISTTPTTGSIGGLSRSANSYLTNQTSDFTGKTTGADLLDEMDSVIHKCNEWTGPGKVDMILTSRVVYQDFERIARALQVIDTNTSERASLGFGQMSYKGIEVFWDPNCDSDKMYTLNTKTLELAYDPANWMQMTGWKEDPDTLDRYAQMYSVLQFIATAFQRNGVIYNITATTS